MIIPVMDAKGTVLLLDASKDVIYMQTGSNGTILFHTESEVYYQIQKVSDWSSILQAMGYLRVDRGTIVNMNRDWRFDDQLKVLKLDSDAAEVRISVSEKAAESVRCGLG